MPFAKGQSGNPGGRSKKLTELARKISEKDNDHRIRLEGIAANGDDKESTAAIKLLWAYAHGNPSQPLTGEGGGPIKLQGTNLLDTLTALAGKK